MEAYSGFKPNERPLRFWLGGHEHRVEQLLDKWYGPSDTWFKVAADDGSIYVLRLAEPDTWTLESFRAKPAQRELEQAQDG